MVRIGALQRTKKPSPAEDPFVEPRRRGPLALPRRHMDRISPHPFGSDPPPSRTSVVSLSILVGTGLVPVDGMRGSIVVSCRSSSQMAHRTTKRRNSTSHLEAKGSREGEKMWPGSQETSSSTGSLPRRHTVDGSEGQGGSQGSGNNLYKTELCRSFEETGSCRYGNKCQFAHGKEELRPVARHPKYKTEVCRTFTTHGTCPYGTRCRFIHYYSPKHEKDGNVSPPITPTQKTPNLPFTGLLSRTSSAHAPVERTPSTKRLPIFEQLVAQDYAENNASNSYEFLQYVEDMQI